MLMVGSTGVRGKQKRCHLNRRARSDERSKNTQPVIHDVASLSSLNTSMKVWYEKVVADTPKSKEALSDSYSWVDVRDAALAHVLALETEAAGGERIITSGGACHCQI